MPPEVTRGEPGRGVSSTRPLARIPAAWRAPLGWLALVWAACFALTASQWAAMAHQWSAISTYQHIVFIPPIIAWLVWTRRAALAGMTPRGWWPGLALLALALFLWLAASLASIDIVAQAAAVFLLQAGTLAILGPRIGAVLLFPLAFAVFLVPFGEEIVVPLQMLTARMVIALTELSGIHARIDGVFIDTPAGLFEVAEACAGVQFLIAMLTLGVLMAKVAMVRWPRRVALLALCLIVPILANGVRAWGIVAIAQVIGAERAAGVDHIVYGWFFFAFVVALILAVAWRWFDRDPQDEGLAAARLAQHPLVAKLEGRAAKAGMLAPLALAAVVLFGLWGGLAGASQPTVPAFRAPEIPDWTLAEAEGPPPWQPTGVTAERSAHLLYRDAQGREVDLYIAAYLGGNDPTASAEGAVPPDTRWKRIGDAPAPGGMFGERLLGRRDETRLAWTAYVIDGQTIAGPMRVRLADLGTRLALRPGARWLVIFSTSGAGDVSASQVLRDFHSASGSPAALAAQTRGR